MRHFTYEKIRDLLLKRNVTLSREFYQQWTEDNDIDEFIEWIVDADLKDFFDHAC